MAVLTGVPALPVSSSQAVINKLLII
jgi:hypothetical protein